MPAIHYADLHAQTHPWVGRPEMQHDAEFAMRQIVDLSISLGADVIDAGDTYNIPRPEGPIVTHVQRMIHDITAAGHQFGYVHGNHSAFPLATSPELRERVIYLAEEDMWIGPHRVRGYDWMSTRDVQRLLPDISLNVEVVVCHWTFREAFDWGAFQLTMDDIPPHVKLWLCGHIHKNFQRTQMAHGQTVLYPGTPYITRLGDNEDSGVFLIDDDLNWTRKPLRRRPLMRVSIEDKDDVERVVVEARKMRNVARDEFPESFAETISQPIVVATWFIDELPGAGKALAQALQGEAHIFEYPMDKASEKIVRDLEQQGFDRHAQLSMAAFLSQEVDKAVDPIVYDSLNLFLSGGTIQDAARHAGIQCGLTNGELETLIPSTRE